MKDKEAMKRHIRNAALPLFLEYGYKGATMRKIAQATGMPLGSMQYYYKRKDHILTDLAESAKNSTAEVIRKLSNPVIVDGGIADEYIEELTSLLVEHVATHGKTILLNLRGSRGTPYETRNRELLEQTKTAIISIIDRLSQSSPSLTYDQDKKITIMAQMVIDLVVAVAERYEPGQWVHDILKEGIIRSFSSCMDIANR